jgi:hypothetical protein
MPKAMGPRFSNGAHRLAVSILRIIADDRQRAKNRGDFAYLDSCENQFLTHAHPSLYPKELCAMTQDYLELAFKHDGGVELRALDDNSEQLDTVIWASDSDPDFMDKFKNELLEPEKDTADILDYLVDKNIIDDDEAAEVEIYEESLDGKDVGGIMDNEPDDDENAEDWE